MHMGQVGGMWGASTGSDCEMWGLKNLWLENGLEVGVNGLDILSLDEDMSGFTFLHTTFSVHP